MKGRRAIAIRVMIVRGAFAIVLGLGLLIQPDKASPALLNFMGLYWLASGLVSVRFGLAGERPRHRFPVLAGLIGVVAGLAVLLRGLLGAQVSEAVLLTLLGVVILLTGVVNIAGGFDVSPAPGRRWRPGLPLGLMEILLGATLAVSPLELGRLVYLAASAWALVGGVVLISDALRMRGRPDFILGGG
jgi:uncharacterized membrane protein HdeD (DUF308 family)